MKSFKKTFKIVCDECGDFTASDTEYCEKCGAKAMRQATSEDYSRYEKSAVKDAKETKKLYDEGKKISDKAKKDAHKATKDAHKADTAEWIVERDAKRLKRQKKKE